MRENMRRLAFWVQITSLEISFLVPFVYLHISPLITAEQYSTVYLHHILIIRPPVKGRLGCFHFWNLKSGVSSGLFPRGFALCLIFSTHLNPASGNQLLCHHSEPTLGLWSPFPLLHSEHGVVLLLVISLPSPVPSSLIASMLRTCHFSYSKQNAATTVAHKWSQ